MAETEEHELTFLEHLEELRWHVVRAAVSIVVFAVIAFLAKDFIFGEILLAPSRLDFWTYRMLCELGEKMGSPILCIEALPFEIQNRTMFGQFSTHLMASFVVGIVCAFPYAFWEVWRFISPGLYEEERKASGGAVFFVSVLFLAGVLFGYYIVSPLAINFLSNYQVDASIVNQIDLTNYISTICRLVLACAIMFQLPVVVYFLSKAGIVTPEFLRAYRKHAFIVMLALSAILTPPDVMSQVLVAMPLVVLYEAGIHISAFVHRKNKQELAVTHHDDEY
ncbi:Sec-independent protein translocase protein TatC [Fulvitalea axinellae]|uniref:Sec-independent protein translocase protein TatC n=1 Tax=Fulvitalea axinellae TaxID=1182444 RepID=A0AAU9CPE9_9BACT|nr:Sec-independent protein translocase protein TatC [Fulvitalea axinellae]